MAEGTFPSQSKSGKSSTMESNGSGTVPSQTKSGKSSTMESNGSDTIPSQSKSSKSSTLESNGSGTVPSQTKSGKSSTMESNGSGTVPSQSKSGKRSTIRNESNCSGTSSGISSGTSGTSSKTDMDITDNLVSRLGIRLDVLDLYTTEMFDDEMFLARRYMVPWRFKRNEKLSRRWKILYQQYMCEEMLVALSEQSLTQLSQDVWKTPVEAENMSSELSLASDIPDQGSAFRVVGKGKLYSSRFKKLKSIPVDTDLCVTKSDTTASIHKDQDQNNNVKSDTASAKTDDVTQSSNNQMEISIGDKSHNNSYTVASVKSPKWKNPSSANFSSDSGFVDIQLIKHQKKSTRQLSSTILKRLEDMTKIYENRKNISDTVRMKTLQRLQELKVKVEITESSNRKIIAARHPNPLHVVSKF